MTVVDKYRTDMDIQNVYYFGISKGGQYAAMYGYRYAWVSRWLSLNMPLFINWHRSKEGLEHLLPSQSIALLFGDHDPSYKYAKLLDILCKDNIKKFILSGAGHNLSGRLDEFILLPEKYLFIDRINNS